MARKRGEYTGQQYRGGRTKGEKNLVKVSGGVQNKHGVVFTEAERKALTNAVNTANRKRARLLKQEGDLHLFMGGQDTGQKLKDSLHLMGKESDFILAPKSKSLQRFKTKDEYDSYMRNLERVNDRGYINKRTEQYRENYKTALRNSFGNRADDIIEKIDKLSPAEYRKLVAQHDEDLEIHFVYSSDEETQKINVIRGALDLDIEELPEPDETYDLKRSAKRKNRRR